MTCFLLQELGPLNVSNEDSNATQRTETPQDSIGDVTPSGTFSVEDMDINLRRTNSARRSWEGGEVSIERSKSSPSRAKPPVPKRPASIKKKPQTSVDAILESAQTGDNISPLRPVSLSLLRDTMASLPVDAQEFLFSEAEINSLSLSSGGQTEKRTNLNSDSNEKEPKLQESLAAQNHIGAVDLSRLEIRRDSGPYDNVPRNNQVMSTRNLDFNRDENKCENPNNSQQSWVSFD